MTKKFWVAFVIIVVGLSYLAYQLDVARAEKYRKFKISSIVLETLYGKEQLDRYSLIHKGKFVYVRVKNGKKTICK